MVRRFPFFVAMHKETDKTHKYSFDSSDKPPWYLLEEKKKCCNAGLRMHNREVASGFLLTLPFHISDQYCLSSESF